MNEKRVILGRPIEGKINRYGGARGPQGTAEEFLAEIDHAFATVPGLQRITWTQHTPSWNDGEPCVFSLGEIRFELDWTAEQNYGEYEDGFVSRYDLYELDYSTSPAPKIFTLDGRNTEAEYWAVVGAMSGLEAGRFEDVVQNAFGDPAEVFATREGFKVEFYEHG